MMKSRKISFFFFAKTFPNFHRPLFPSRVIFFFQFHSTPAIFRNFVIKKLRKKNIRIGVHTTDLYLILLPKEILESGNARLVVCRVKNYENIHGTPNEQSNRPGQQKYDSEYLSNIKTA